MFPPLFFFFFKSLHIASESKRSAQEIYLDNLLQTSSNSKGKKKHAKENFTLTFCVLWFAYLLCLSVGLNVTHQRFCKQKREIASGAEQYPFCGPGESMCFCNSFVVSSIFMLHIKNYEWMYDMNSFIDEVMANQNINPEQNKPCSCYSMLLPGWYYQ